MKRCPECGRDYSDDTLLYCLDDGNTLLEGPASVGEPATAILSEPGAVATGVPASESPTRAQINTTDKTAILRTGAEAEPQGHLGDSSERQSHSANRAQPEGKGGSRQWRASLGQILNNYDYDFAKAEKEYRRAIELNPNYASAHQWLGEMLAQTGRFMKSVKTISIGSSLISESTPSATTRVFRIISKVGFPE